MCKVIDIFTKQEIKPASDTAATRTPNSLKNECCAIEYDESEKSISGTDFTDIYNIPCFYTTRKRNIKKAWEELKRIFKDNTTMSNVTKILNKYNLKCHVWDSMD